MELAVLYEDGEIWIKMTPEELSDKLSKKLKRDVRPAMTEVIAEIKKRTLNA